MQSNWEDIFWEVIDHFVVGGDEACFMADANGSLKVMGAAGVKKHEKKVSDMRPSITAFRSGTAAGNNGSTGFIMIMRGVRKKTSFTYEWLLKEGCEVGSTILVNEEAFMTDESWLEMSKLASICVVFDLIIWQHPPIFIPLLSS